MLTSLPRPATLRTNLQTVDATLTTTLPADLLSYKNSLSDFESNTLDMMATPVTTISASQPTVSDLRAKMTAYDVALDALPG